MEPDLIIYHGPECYDGFTAAWLLHKHFPDAEFMPANYGVTEAPDVTGKCAIVVDFSWDRDTMIRMADQAEEILVLDHHKTAEENLRHLDFAVFDMERSGCRMAFDWLVGQGLEHPDDGLVPAHWLIRHVEDRDLWRMAFEHTKSVHAYYTSIRMTFEEWDELAATDLTIVVMAGAAIRRSIDRYCEKVGEHRYLMFTELSWGKVQVVNAPYLNGSELADHLLRTGDTEWSAAWFKRADGMYQYSLRSRGDFDVSIVARNYGGGGHKNAAGFSSRHPPDNLWSAA